MCQFFIQGRFFSADGNSATVTFKQDYRADALKMKNDKTLVMAKGKTGDWQITSENSN